MTLPKELRHHLVTVLRLEPGATFRVFDGQGRVADAVLRGDDQIDLQQMRVVPPPPCPLTLIQGLPKGEKAELILQKGTELGVSRFVLVPMARSIVRLKRESRQQQRWEKIIQEAARQCQQYQVPELQVAGTFARALSMGVDADLKLLLWENSDQPLTAMLDKTRPRSAAVIVGPEGGITSEEAAQAQAQGFLAVGLGSRILRTETAGLAIISVLQYLFGDLS